MFCGHAEFIVTQTDVNIEAEALLDGIITSSPSGVESLFNKTLQLKQSGLFTGDFTDLASRAAEGNSLVIGTNPAPSSVVYPQKSSTDAPYSASEASLRSAVKIPTSFTFGQKPPVILVPGTASTGYIAFVGNYLKLLTGQSYADPVWLDVPNYLLGDAQVNAEYVAYAINYISSISNNQNVSVIAWSQGNLNTQWALKYWPSTRGIVSDFISMSADFHGTTEAYLICLSAPELGCTPSVIQQEYESLYVNALRRNGGDSAYVPTTSIYSATDDIVQPQSGTGASAFLQDGRNFGVTNAELQTICPGQPAGGVVSHGDVLINALAYALAVDALTHDGPGSLSRIDLPTVCAQPIAPGLDLNDFLLNESTSIFALLAISEYNPKVAVEPPLKSYALLN
ncbi:alpha/beta-hydrolase [Microthyrium microscopicum]|uniref:Alpha/beta-hydrolase n=1 Tax=Microthyrium microscopicum TaxID=703497 RepID=A0A6A6U9U8_9PEZI|nr:alpha/beta-hydrolase [Microthyrium microscopicum]